MPTLIKQRKHLHREWDGLPVFDAKSPLRVMIRPEDLQKAEKRSPGECVFAQACKRAFNAHRVAFFRSVGDGSHHVERFQLTEEMQRLVAAFDRGKRVIPEAGFVLLPPRKTRKLEKKRLTQAKYKENLKAVAGKPRKRKVRHGKRPVADMTVRNGIGTMRFLSSEANRARRRKLQQAAAARKA